MNQVSVDQAILLEKMRPSEASPVSLVSTLAHSSAVLDQVNRMAGVFQKSSVATVDREFIILNVAAFCRSRYLFAEHAPIAVNAGLAKGDLDHLWRRSTSPSWSEEAVGLIAFSNEILASDSISDESWRLVYSGDDPGQMIELIALIGFYRMISVFTNTLRMDIGDFDGHVPNEREAVRE